MAKTTEKSDTKQTPDKPDMTEYDHEVHDHSLLTESEHVNPLETTKKTPPKNAAKNTESVYTADDLANAARVRFKVAPEVVSAALKFAGKTEATLAEAQKTVNEFMAKEVK